MYRITQQHQDRIMWCHCCHICPSDVCRPPDRRGDGTEVLETVSVRKTECGDRRRSGGSAAGGAALPACCGQPTVPLCVTPTQWSVGCGAEQRTDGDSYIMWCKHNTAPERRTGQSSSEPCTSSSPWWSSSVNITSLPALPLSSVMEKKATIPQKTQQFFVWVNKLDFFVQK